jgi:hypothetical protein
MLLDTGADASLVPRGAIEVLGLSASQDRLYELIGFDGNTSFVPVVSLELVFCHRSFKGQFLVVDQQWGILGRNVLNSVSVVFDGPNLQWDEERTG